MVPRASFDQKIEMLKIRRRLIRSMRNRISYSVAVAVSPETFQNEVFWETNSITSGDAVSYLIDVITNPRTIFGDFRTDLNKITQIP